jgi:hypothetical protein
VTPRRQRRSTPESANLAAARVLGESEVSLLEVVDHVLNQGVVLSGEVTLGLAGIDLIYVRLLALLCSADRVTGRTRASRKPRRRR